MIWLIYESSIINFPRNSESSDDAFIVISEQIVLIGKSALDFLQQQLEALYFFFTSSITFGSHTKQKNIMNPCRQFRTSVNMNKYNELLNAHEIDSMVQVVPIMMNKRK